MLKKIVLALVILAGYPMFAIAETSMAQQKVSTVPQTNPVQERVATENKAQTNPYAILFYKPTYVMPYYYTGSPYNSVYVNNTPNNESLDSDEVKYQISFKVPAWKNMFHSTTSFYLAYTQLSYWQAYNHQAF